MIITGRALPLPQDNIDTDQIIAAEYLKTLTRRGLGRHAFAGLRSTCPELTDPAYVDATIIIAGRNFGCGSSREHAVWALLDMGVRAVVAETFSDIFAGNAFKTGLLTIALLEPAIAELSHAAATRDVSIALEEQFVRCGDLSLRFQMDPFRRQCLLEGLDEIDLTLQHESKITAYENQDLN